MGALVPPSSWLLGGDKVSRDYPGVSRSQDNVEMGS